MQPMSTLWRNASSPIWGDDPSPLARRGALDRRRAPAVAVALVMLLLAPALRRWLESSMTVQMLVQLPALAACGALLARGVPSRLMQALEPWNRSGVSALVLASVSAAFWMLPRALDAGVMQPPVTALKYVTLPLLVGLPLALAWPRMSFVVKGVLALEAIATLFRLGWLYLASPDRLCTLYRIDDQQRLGGWLLALGGLATLAVASKLLFGRFGMSETVDPARAAEAAAESGAHPEPVAPRHGRPL